MTRGALAIADRLAGAYAMLMDILEHVVSSTIGDAVAPSDDAGWVRLTRVLAFLAAAAHVGGYLISSDPWHGPPWAFNLMTAGVLLGTATVALSLVGLARKKDDRRAYAISAILGAAALTWPVLAGSIG